MRVCAKWTDDCSGKKDYDGQIVRLSTRYWPAGGGYMIYDPKNGLQDANDGSLPSANASILLEHGTPDEYGYDDYVTLAEKEFSGETFEEVKVQVEEWAQEQFDRIHEAMRALFSAKEVERE